MQFENKNIQTRLNPDCDQVFFIFTGKAHGLGLTPLEFFKQSKMLDRNLVIFRDLEHKFYMNGVGENISSFKELLAWQKKFLEESPWIKNIYCIGTSSGGIAAILAGHHLNADKVWSFALARPKNPITCRGMGNLRRPRFIRSWKTIAASNKKTQYDLYYNKSYKIDNKSAQKFKKCEGVTLFPMNGSGHIVMTVIVENGILETLIPEKSPNKNDNAING